LPAAGPCLRDALDRRGSHGGQGEGDAGGGSRCGTGLLARGVHEPGETGGSDAERQLDAPSEHVPAGVDGRDIAQYRRVELDVAEGLPRALETQFGLGRAVGVVEGTLGGPTPGYGAQVLYREGRLQSPGRRVPGWFLESEQ
jgi:hypothetical protein